MPDRHHLRRLGHTWARHPRYFLTLCTAHRRPILASRTVATILVGSWRAAPEVHEWAVGRYVIMPDHVHLIATALSERKALSDFVRDWKKWTTRELVRGAIAPAPVWQAEFFDHVLRSAESYAEKAAYIRENPVRAGLVAEAAAWPYGGECEVISV